VGRRGNTDDCRAARRGGAVPRRHDDRADAGGGRGVLGAPPRRAAARPGGVPVLRLRSLDGVHRGAAAALVRAARPGRARARGSGRASRAAGGRRLGARRGPPHPLLEPAGAPRASRLRRRAGPRCRGVRDRRGGGERRPGRRRKRRADIPPGRRSSSRSAPRRSRRPAVARRTRSSRASSSPASSGRPPTTPSRSGPPVFPCASAVRCAGTTKRCGPTSSFPRSGGSSPGRGAEPALAAVSFRFRTGRWLRNRRAPVQDSGDRGGKGPVPTGVVVRPEFELRRDA
jgi:hypothetical protein